MVKLLCLLVLASATATAQVVEGTIVNSATGAGIAGIGVNLEQVTTGAYRVYQARSDAEGHYRLENVQDGVYRVIYASNDYALADSREAQQIRIAAGEKVRLEARMLPLPRVSGRVLDGRGNPVPKVRVDLDGPDLVFEAETNAAGKFDIRVLPGAIVLSAVPPADWKPPDPEPGSGRAMAGRARTIPGPPPRQAQTDSLPAWAPM